MESKKRIVVKVGTSTIIRQGNGLNFREIERLARTLADLKNDGHEVILVTSGAIGAGSCKLNLKKKADDIRVKQAVAAVGQCELMHIYDKFFGEYGCDVGQILFSKDDVDRPTVKLNLIGTFEALLKMGVIPVVNENDSVCVSEIESEYQIFGDNDTLSAVVAVLVGADLLIILSDIDGLFDKDPHVNEDAKLISVVDEIDESVMRLAGGAVTSLGTGGMVTKLAAAQITTDAGIDMVIMNGSNTGDIYSIVHGGNAGTLFKGKKGGQQK